MANALRSLKLDGFKSIKSLDLQLDDLTVLIGANGSGKSNFVDFFRMLRAIADEGLQSFVQSQGGGDGFFFLGPKHTPRIEAEMAFGSNRYQFELTPAMNGILIEKEFVQYTGGQGIGTWQPVGQGVFESRLKERRRDRGKSGSSKGVCHYVYEAISSWVVYHFHDTSMLAPMRRSQALRDREKFRHDASNIAAFLLHLRQTHDASYRLIRDTVRLIAPFFSDFQLLPERRGNEEVVRLEWNQKGSDFPFQPHHLSDGTMRFICMATALLQPTLPSTILIDEPELGLHPSAIAVLSDLVKSCAARTQVILSTQSPTLLDHFQPEQIVVVNRVGPESEFKRLEGAGLADWLDDYSVGELWQKNVVRAGPTHG